MIQVGAEFTKNQKFSIEELKERRKRDHKLDMFLNEQRLRPECRRLGLEALLPVEHQRLVKYPLLLEQLAKQCDKEAEEYAKVRRCVDRSREILDSIDKQVAEAQNIQRLAEIQRNLDTSGLEKMPDSPITNEYRVSINFLAPGRASLNCNASCNHFGDFFVALCTFLHWQNCLQGDVSPL